MWASPSKRKYLRKSKLLREMRKITKKDKRTQKANLLKIRRLWNTYLIYSKKKRKRAK